MNDPLPSLAESQQKSVHKQSVKSGRGYILAVGILQLLSGLFFGVLSKGDNLADGGRGLLRAAVTMGIIGLLYVGLWVWAKSAPFAAAIVALTLYVSLIALDAVYDPTTLIQGIIVKILIITGLVKAVQSSYALKKAAEAS